MSSVAKAKRPMSADWDCWMKYIQQVMRLF